MILCEEGCGTQLEGSFCAVTDNCVILHLGDNGFASLSEKLNNLTEVILTKSSFAKKLRWVSLLQRKTQKKLFVYLLSESEQPVDVVTYLVCLRKSLFGRKPVFRHPTECSNFVDVNNYQSLIENNFPELRPQRGTASTKTRKENRAKKKKRVHTVAPRGRCVSEKQGPEEIVKQWSALDAAHKVLKERHENVIVV